MEEWRTLITQVCLEELEEQRDLMDEDSFMRVISQLVDFKKGGQSLVYLEESDFDDPGHDIPKWDSGVEPLDRIQQGFYQGVFVIMGSPGTGKTSTMLSLAAMMRLKNVADEIHFYQLEIPKSMFQYRAAPLMDYLKEKNRPFKKGKDKIFYGLRPFSEVLLRVQQDPNPNRVIFYDSPDVLAASIGEDRRIELGNIYRDLVILKQYCKAVFVASQPRRRDSNKRLQMESVSEAWEKAWYSDGIIGIQKIGLTNSHTAIHRAAILKNRFGPCDQEIRYDYDMISLLPKLRNDSTVTSASGWSESEEGW
jgi:hypothetical protein